MEDDEYSGEMPATLSTSAVAQMLELTSETVVARLRAGAIPAHRIGGFWIIFKTELRAFVESRNYQVDRSPSAPVDVLAGYGSEMTYKDLIACLGKTKQTIYT
jgi:excisionase family DNA binding protein